MKISLFLCLLLALGLVPLAAQDEAPLAAYPDRTYDLHLPDGYDPDQPAPLLIALHPFASSGKALAALTSLNTAAADFIIAYPHASGFAWADGREQDFSVVNDAEDISFIAALIDQLSHDYAVNADRVYLTGLANGGSMAYRLACELPERFAGVAVVGALLWEYHTTKCPEAGAPPRMLIIHGARDPVYLTEGNTLSFSATLGVNDTLKFWALRGGCDLEQGSRQGNIIQFESCASAEHLAYYRIEGGGSVWPRTGDYRLNSFGVDASTMLINFFAGDAGWDTPQAAVPDTPPRSYNLFVPSGYTPDEPMPLVLVLHGRPDTGAGMAYISDMNTVAEREGFIALYPDGLNREWNYGRDLPTYNPSVTQDDSLFLSDLISDLSHDLQIDQQRIYVTGFSNGGLMTQRLACENPGQYAAYAAVGASAFLGIPLVCEDTPPVPILFIHGTHDISIPWNGFPRELGGSTVFITAPVMDSLGYWANHNNCSQQFEDIALPSSDPETRVQRLAFDCAGDIEMLFYGVIGGGHNWPGVPGRLPADIAGKVNMDINASEVIWAFFTQYTR